jgi:hypothetical protein
MIMIDILFPFLHILRLHAPSSTNMNGLHSVYISKKDNTLLILYLFLIFGLEKYFESGFEIYYYLFIHTWSICCICAILLIEKKL